MTRGTHTNIEQLTDLIELSVLRDVSRRLPIIVGLISAIEHSVTIAVEFLVREYSMDIEPIQVPWGFCGGEQQNPKKFSTQKSRPWESFFNSLLGARLSSSELYYINIADRMVRDSTSFVRAHLVGRADPKIDAIKHIDSHVRSIKYEALEVTRVLIVDDDPRLVRRLSNSLADELGAWVDSADNGRAAYFQMLEMLPDVCLVDFMLPGREGEKLVAKARQCAHLRDTKFIFLSSLFPDDARSPGDLTIGSSICIPKSSIAIKAIPDIVRQVHRLGYLAKPVLGER